MTAEALEKDSFRNGKFGAFGKARPTLAQHFRGFFEGLRRRIVPGQRDKGGRRGDRPIENGGGDVEVADSLARAALAQLGHGGDDMRPWQGRPRRRQRRSERASAPSGSRPFRSDSACCIEAASSGLIASSAFTISRRQVKALPGAWEITLHRQWCNHPQPLLWH